MLKDKDIREGLFNFLEDEYGKIRIFEEKTMGRSRADVVMITSQHIVGIEIKSVEGDILIKNELIFYASSGIANAEYMDAIFTNRKRY